MPASEKLPVYRRSSPMTRAVVAWVNKTHDGNVSAAARAIGCEYTALWRCVRGVTVKPDIVMLRKLAQHTDTTLDAWLDGKGV